MPLRGADGDALAQRMQQMELVAQGAQPAPQEAREQPGEVTTAVAEERAALQGWAELPEERAALQGWAELPAELLVKVLEVLQEAGRSEPQEGGLGFTKAVAAVREVCVGWQAVHDAAVMRLRFERRATDEAVGMLVRRFPAVASVHFMRIGECEGHEVTDEAVLAVCSLPALTSLNLTECWSVTDEAARAVSERCSALTTLHLTHCEGLTDDGVRAASSMRRLSSLSLAGCMQITDQAVLDVSGMIALTSLDLFLCEGVSDVGVRALSSLPALTHLDLGLCNVTAAGVQALRNTTAAPDLRVVHP